MPWEAFSYDGKSFRKCPRYLIDGAVDEYIRLYTHYKNGFLMNPGGILQQPALYVECMEIIHGAVNETDEE
jgi:hypothetical protein